MTNIDNLPALPEPAIELYPDVTPVIYQAWADQMRAYAREAIRAALGAGGEPVAEVVSGLAEGSLDVRWREDFCPNIGDRLYTCPQPDQSARIAELEAELASWRDTLSAVMPADFKDWFENNPAEWPEVAASVIVNLRKMEQLAWDQLITASQRGAERMREACAALVAEIGPPLGTIREIRALPTSPAPADTERHFCERCGKRLGAGIHTCTPPEADAGAELPAAKSCTCNQGPHAAYCDIFLPAADAEGGES